jgi:hypothetical protein
VFGVEDEVLDHALDEATHGVMFIVEEEHGEALVQYTILMQFSFNLSVSTF